MLHGAILAIGRYGMRSMGDENTRQSSSMLVMPCCFFQVSPLQGRGRRPIYHVHQRLSLPSARVKYEEIMHPPIAIRRPSHVHYASPPPQYPSSWYPEGCCSSLSTGCNRWLICLARHSPAARGPGRGVCNGHRVLRRGQQTREHRRTPITRSLDLMHETSCCQHISTAPLNK